MTELTLTCVDCAPSENWNGTVDHDRTRHDAANSNLGNHLLSRNLILRTITSQLLQALPLRWTTNRFAD